MGSTKTPSPASACLAALAALCAGAAAPASAEDAPAPPPPLPFDARALQAATDHPVNASGRVVAKNPADGTYEADRPAVPDHRARARLRLRHPVFVVDASRDTVFRDIEIERCPSFGATIRPLSENVRFERFRIRAPEGDPALYAANADGIHVVGLAGRLVMRDCHFRGLGDDVLNVHAKAAEIESFDPATGAISVLCRDPGGGKARLPRGWARPGDALAVYDAATLLPKGRLAVTSWRDSGRGIATPAGDAAKVAPGDFVANERDFPSVEISGCTFEKCGMNGSPANLGAVTVKTSHDAGSGNGPAGVHRDLHIVGNAFCGCGAGGVYVESAHGVSIRDNTFEDLWRNPPPGAGADRRPVRLHHCDGVDADETGLYFSAMR